MPKQQKAQPKNKMETAIVVALIGLAGTIIAALLASPLLTTMLESSTPPSSTPPSASTIR